MKFVLTGASLVLLALFAMAAPAKAAPKPLILAQAETAKIFHGVGKITAIDASAGLVSIDHGEIVGLMDAMEMQYEAKPAKILEGLTVGDKVAFAVDGKTLTILEIGKRAPGK